MKKRKNPGPLFFKPARASARKTPQADVTATIERLSAEGRGMAFRDGKPLFVPRTLPGETVTARITLEKREYAEAELGAVSNPSAERIAPRCDLFGRCGGCDLQMLDYQAQLRHKSATLAHLLRAHVDTLDTAIVAAPWHYRHRARFAVGEEDGRPVIGFKAGNSHRVIAVRTCVILDERLQPLLDALPQALAQLEQWQRIEEIRVAVDSDGGIGLQWRTRRSLPVRDAQALAAFCAAHGVVSGADTELVYRVPDQGTAFRFTPADFTQVNPAVNARLVARALDWLQPRPQDVVADYFCGLGNFSLPLAQCAGRVTGYELDAAMVARASANATGLVNLEFRVADLYAVDAATADEYDIALLDPPRAGARALCERLAAARTLRRIVYVSCNPQTLVRDIDILVRGGFRVARAALVDMFPQTGHIETIAELERASL